MPAMRMMVTEVKGCGKRWPTSLAVLVSSRFSDRLAQKGKWRRIENDTQH